MKEKTYMQSSKNAAISGKFGAFLLILVLGIPIFLVGMIFGLIFKKSEQTKSESIE